MQLGRLLQVRTPQDMADSFYGAPVSSPGPAPPPPPKPYSEASRTGTPVTSNGPQQTRYSQHYSQPPPLPQSQSPDVSQTSQCQTSAGGQYQAQPDQNASMFAAQGPSLPQSFELPESITKQTTADLSQLLSNPELLVAVAQNHPAYAAALQPLQYQISQNVALATQVASAEAQFQALREQTGQLMLQHTSLQTQWRRKQAEMDEALAPWGPRAMYQRLLAGINEQKNMLDAVQESFLDESGDAGHIASEKEVTDWIKRIREGTTVLEKRREMRARWDEGRVGGWR